MHTFYRVRASIDVMKPLKKQMKMKKDNESWTIVDFRYERLPTFCFLCGVIGHGEKYCHTVLNGGDQAIVKPYGPWLLAGMRRSVPSAGQQWVAPAVHVDRQNWKSPAYGQPTIQYPSSKGKESMNANAGVSEPNASDDSEVVYVEQKKRRMMNEGSSLNTTVVVMDIEARRITGKRRFCFDNTWLREDTCRDIVLHSWERTLGLDVLLKIEACSNDIASRGWRNGGCYFTYKNSGKARGEYSLDTASEFGGDDDPYVSTNLSDSISGATVSSLFDEQGKGWDKECVKDIFNERDANLIINIPLSLRKPPDSWVWYLESKGIYSVKSCYKLLIGEVDDVRPWNRIWDLQVCHLCGSVQESAYHLFVECQEVGTLWSSICLPVLSNEKVWNGVSVDLNIMKCKALTFLANWKYANGLEEITHTMSSTVESLWRSVTGSNPDPSDYSGIEFWSNPERAGWLTKQGDYIKTWRRRWFVLKQGKLLWFKDPSSASTPDAVPRGVVPVNECLTVKGAEDVLHKPFSFELSTSRYTMYFIANSEKEKEDWINSIGRSIVQHSRSLADSEVIDYDSRQAVV
nr:pleckstrin homology domain-containing protein 1-like [Ipomoea batatas]